MFLWRNNENYPEIPSLSVSLFSPHICSIQDVFQILNWYSFLIYIAALIKTMQIFVVKFDIFVFKL